MSRPRPGLTEALLVEGPHHGFSDVVHVNEPPPIVTVSWCDHCRCDHLFEPGPNHDGEHARYALDLDAPGPGLVYRYADIDNALDLITQAQPIAA